MDVLILNTVGRRSGQPRKTPVAWVAHPDQASIELPGRDAEPVTPHRLEGADREQAWQRITAVQSRYAKYQSKSDREYPVIRLTLR